MRRPGPRFTIRSLMIAVAVVAGLLTLFFRVPISPILVGGMLVCSCILIEGLRRMFHGFRRVAALCFGVAGGLANLATAMVCIYKLKLGVAILSIWGWFILLPIILGAGAGWATAATGATVESRRSPFLVWPLVLVLAFAPLSMLLTHWPLRLAFLVSRPAMERLADRVAAGQRITRPELAGLFLVVGSGVDRAKGNVGLIVDADPSGRSGFVRLGPDVPEHDTYGPFYNLNFNEHLADRWFYQDED
jgi:hypothetical protein